MQFNHLANCEVESDATLYATSMSLQRAPTILLSIIYSTIKYMTTIRRSHTSMIRAYSNFKLLNALLKEEQLIYNRIL